MKKSALFLACCSLVFGFSASSFAGNQKSPAIFETGVVASTGGSVAVAGVPSTGAPFTVDPGGEAKIDELGNLKVEFSGLARGSDGLATAEEVFVSLVCNGAIVNSSAPVTLDLYEETKIEEVGFVASDCLQPVLLIRRNGCTVAAGCGSDEPDNTRWLAISGFMMP